MEISETVTVTCKGHRPTNRADIQGPSPNAGIVGIQAKVALISPRGELALRARSVHK